MDLDARLYQDQLHKLNSERMDRFECKMDKVLEVIASVGEIIKRIPSMDDRIKELESERDQRKGAIAILAFLSGLVGAALESFVHHFIGR